MVIDATVVQRKGTVSPCWGKGQISNFPRVSSTKYVTLSIGGIGADARVRVKNIRGRVLQGFKAN